MVLRRLLPLVAYACSVFRLGPVRYPVEILAAALPSTGAFWSWLTAGVTTGCEGSESLLLHWPYELANEQPPRLQSQIMLCLHKFFRPAGGSFSVVFLEQYLAWPWEFLKHMPGFFVLTHQDPVSTHFLLPRSILHQENKTGPHHLFDAAVLYDWIIVPC